jgi:type II secretory pathway component PulF
MSVLVLIALVAVAAVGGIIAYRADSTARAAIAQAMSVFCASLAIGMVLLYVGPRFKETVIGFGVELPGLTVWAMHVVDLALTYAPFVLLNLVGSSILGVVLFFLGHRDPESRGTAKNWSLVATLTISVSIAFFFGMLLLPLPRLLDALS